MVVKRLEEMLERSLGLDFKEIEVNISDEINVYKDGKEVKVPGINEFYSKLIREFPEFKEVKHFIIRRGGSKIYIRTGLRYVVLGGNNPPHAEISINRDKKIGIGGKEKYTLKEFLEVYDKYVNVSTYNRPMDLLSLKKIHLPLLVFSLYIMENLRGEEGVYSRLSRIL